MAIIYTYPLKATPTPADLLLISDVADKNKTKRVKISTLPGGVDFVGVGGDGTVGKIPKWSTQFNLTDSSIFEASVTGDIGIGTISPASRLHVYQNNNTTNTAAGITVEQQGTGDAVVQYLLTGSQRWVTGIDNSLGNNFRISSSADLGTDTKFSISTDGEVSIFNNLNRPVTIKGEVIIKGSSGGWATGYNFKGSGNTLKGGFGALGSADTLTYFYIGDSYDDVTMVVQPDAGNVGIGTTTPSSKLTILDSVDRDMSSTAAGQFQIGGSGYQFAIAMGSTETALYTNSSSRSLTLGTNETPRLTVLGTGNVGIGTTAPVEKLDVRGILRVSPDQISATQTGIILKDNGTGTGEGLNIDFQSASDINTAFIGSVSSDNLRIGTAGAEKIRILGNGNVGIGTTNPAFKLSVNGGDIEVKDSTSGLVLHSTGNDTLYRIQVDDSGNLTTTNINP